MRRSLRFSVHHKVTVRPGAARLSYCHRKDTVGVVKIVITVEQVHFQPDTDVAGHTEPHHHRPEHMYISHIYSA